jgi:hypothetical protein
VGKYLNEELKLDDRLGQIGINKDGDQMQIIEYYTYDDIEVKFLDGNDCIVHTQYINFLKGYVKNYNKPSVGKHGFLGQGKYTSEHRDENGNRILHTEYKIWSGIHNRAGNFDGKHSSYSDVTVCEEWWNYQNFAKWYEEHKYDIKDDFLCIDKDILNPKNRIYSPETCCLIPNSINEIFKDFTNYKHDDLPIGITKRNDCKTVKYRARTTSVNEYGEIVYVSKTTSDLLEAFIFYKENKEKYIKFLAEKYKYCIDYEIYERLMNFKVTTTYDFNKLV